MKVISCGFTWILTNIRDKICKATNMLLNQRRYERETKYFHRFTKTIYAIYEFKNSEARKLNFQEETLKYFPNNLQTSRLHTYLYT